MMTCQILAVKGQGHSRLSRGDRCIYGDAAPSKSILYIAYRVMLVPIVLFVLCGLITSPNAGPTFVTHECVRSSADVTVSSSLCTLVADRRLHFTADRFYRPQPVSYTHLTLPTILRV